MSRINRHEHLDMEFTSEVFGEIEELSARYGYCKQIAQSLLHKITTMDLANDKRAELLNAVSEHRREVPEIKEYYDQGGGEDRQG